MNSPNAQAYNKTNATIISIGITWRERGCDSEKFGTRITWFRVTVEKISMIKVLGTKSEFWKVLGSSLENCRGTGELDLQFRTTRGFKLQKKWRAKYWSVNRFEHPRA
jgi:hypothetical protein